MNNHKGRKGKPVIWGGREEPFPTSKALAEYLDIAPQMVYDYINAGRKLKGYFVDFKI